MSRVSIGFDATSIRHSGKGVARYQRSLLSALAGLDDSPEITAFVALDANPADLPDAPHIRYRQVRATPALWWEQVGLLGAGAALPLIHTTTDRLPLVPTGRYLLYLFEDPTYRIHLNRSLGTGIYQRASDLLTQVLWRRSLARADLVMVSSRNTRRDVERAGVRLRRPIRVIYPGVDDAFQPAGSMDRKHLADQFGGSGYVLHLTSSDPRDDSSAALRAFAAARNRTGGKVRLVIGGDPGTTIVRLRHEVEELDLGEAVHFVGHQSGRTLVELYQGATAYLDPTLFEGFGFQLAEALACGVPVVSYAVTSVPEVVGKGGLLAPKGHLSALTENLVRLLSDEALRTDLALRAQEQGRRFRWQETAQATVGVYRELTGTPVN